MSVDRQLVERIKARFARKSSARLGEIAAAGSDDRWSAEALVAAGELLEDRAAGRADEPTDPEEDQPPASPDDTLGSLALLAGINAFALPLGVLILPTGDAHDPVSRDRPVPFGPQSAWLALDTTDTAGVANALGLWGAREATWGEGIAAARGSSAFVTPPVGDWTLVVSAALFPPRRPAEFLRPLLERLSGRFGEVQYFFTHSGAGLHGWARAEGGRLLRGFAWFGEEGLTLWDEGPATQEERDLGFGRGHPADAKPDQDAEATHPEEADVLQLAACWSIDPTTLDEHFKEPRLGLLAKAGWGARLPPPGHRVSP